MYSVPFETISDTVPGSRLSGCAQLLLVCWNDAHSEGGLAARPVQRCRLALDEGGDGEVDFDVGFGENAREG